MPTGEVIARIITATVALVEATLGGFVNVANVSGNITPSLPPFGEDFVGILAKLVEGMTSLLSTIMSYLS